MPAFRTDPQVSILIPARNAGHLFEDVLRGLGVQRGVHVLEILVADSGSTDGTAEIARAAGAEVVAVEPDSFNHGRARNQLADRACGNVLVFTVQDAVLVGGRSLARMVSALERDASLAAVSARQQPRPGADLHSQYHLWATNEALTAVGMMDSTGHRVLRRLRPGAVRAGRASHPLLANLVDAVVDNVCAAMPRAVWEELRFKELDFGEDLDFGIRARSGGRRSRFLSRARVAHHHDRDGAYQLSRAAVGGQRLAELLPDAEFPGGDRRIDELAADVRGLFRDLEGALDSALAGRSEVALAEYAAAVARALKGDAPRAEPTGELAAMDQLLGEVVGDGSGRVPLDAKLVAVFESDSLRRFGGRSAGAVSRADARSFLSRVSGSALGWDFAKPMLEDPHGQVATRFHGRVRGQHDR